MLKIINKLNEGGPLFTYPILILFFIIIALVIKELVKPKNPEKTIEVLSTLGWLSVAWAFFGHTIGLITAFDSIEAAGELAPMHFASGLKIALLNLLNGAFILLTARIGMLILILKHKK